MELSETPVVEAPEVPKVNPIEEMNNSLDGTTSTEAKIEEPVVEAPIVKEPKVEKVEKQDDPQQTITDLRAKLAELEAAKKEDKVEPKPPPAPEEFKVDDQDFTKDLDLDEVTRSPEELNKLLNDVHKKAVVNTRQAILEQLPELINQQVEITQTLHKINEDFYRNNPDLVEFKKVVGTVWKELAEKGPDRSMVETVKDVAPEVRKRLGLSEPKAKVDPIPEPKSKPKEVPPRLPKKFGTGGRETPNVKEPNSLTSQIEEMNKVVA